MKGSIRILAGFLITFGAVGHMDVNPDANLLVQALLALGGLAIAFSGVLAIQKQNIG